MTIDKFKLGLAASPEAFASWVVPLATEHGVVFS